MEMVILLVIIKIHIIRELKLGFFQGILKCHDNISVLFGYMMLHWPESVQFEPGIKDIEEDWTEVSLVRSFL